MSSYVRSDVADASPVSSSRFCDIIQVGGFRVTDVYKSPSQHWDQGLLSALVHPAAYVGDFNSHHPDWGYSEPDEDKEALAEWASNSDLALTHDAKQPGTFYSARWQKDYSPDLCWITLIGDHPQPASQMVLGYFPHSQHRPLLFHIGLQLPIIHGSSKKPWNLHKADWDLYSGKLERSVVTIPSRCIPIEEAYQRFQGAIFSAATTAIPRGCRPVYTPCLENECQALLEEYEGSGNPDIAEYLIESQMKPMGRISGKTQLYPLRSEELEPDSLIGCLPTTTRTIQTSYQSKRCCQLPSPGCKSATVETTLTIHEQ